MAIQDKLDLLIKFDLPVLPFFSLQDNTDYGSEGISSANVLGNLIITNPLGLVHSNTSWVTPDITLATSAYFNSVNIPLDNGVPLAGTYTFEYTINVFTGGVQQGIYSKTFTINYTYVSPLVSIVFDNNPYIALLTSRDNTRYVIDGVTPTQTRVFTLVFPDLSNYPNIANSLFYIAVTNPFYIDGLYQSTVLTELNYQFLTYSVHDKINGANQILVEDTVDIQSIYCCLKKLNDTVVANPLDYASSTKLLRATSLLEMFEQAVQLGDYNGANNFIAQIYAVTGCSKGCTCGGLKKTTIQPYWQTVSTPTPSSSSSSEFRVGDIKPTFRTDPQTNWEYLENQVFKITDYQDYFNVVGTIFNNGSEPPGYFRNEDGRSRGIIGAGQGVGLTNRVLGTKYGSEYTNATHHHAVALNATGNTPTLSSSNVAVGGSITIPSGTCSVTISGATSAGTRALSINSITPTGTVTLPTFHPGGIGTLNTNVSGTADGNTDSTSLSLIGSINVTGATCVKGGTSDAVSAMDCTAPLVIDIGSGNITPNGHTHSITALPLTMSQGLAGSLDAPYFTGSVSFSGDLTPITGTVDVGLITVTGSGSGTTSTPSATATLTGGTCSISPTAITLGVSGNTADAVLNISVLHPVFAAMWAVKVR